MFLMFSLRRPDILPVGDLGVQKGLVRWILAAHGALPVSTKAKGKASQQAREKYGLGTKGSAAVKDKVDGEGNGEIDTLVKVDGPATPPRRTAGLPPTPLSPNGATVTIATLHTPDTAGPSRLGQVPPTPLSPGVKPAENFVVGQRELPPPAPEEMLVALSDHPSWDIGRIAPLSEGLSVELLKSRLSGKKAK
jgi:DNA-3-methyladenine glycosylase II